MLQNRFLTVKTGGRRPATARAQAAWSRAQSADDRRLVVLIENGGVELPIPALVDQVLSAPGLGLVVPDGFRRQIVDGLRDRIRKLTDGLLEDAELRLNRYAAAKPGLYGDVVILRDASATIAALERTLVGLSRQGKLVDLLVLAHGWDKLIALADGEILTEKRISEMRVANGRALPLRSVYMMTCRGATLNEAWLKAGAKVSAGATDKNVLPEPMTYFFWKAWTEGRTFQDAATSAYVSAVGVVNEAIRGLVRALPLPGIGLLADKIDVGKVAAIAGSAPAVAGQGGLQVSSDALSFDQSAAGAALTTTVVPTDWLRASTPAEPFEPFPRSAFELLRRWEPPQGGAWSGAALAALEQQAEETARALRELVRYPLNRNQRAALISFAHGIGLASFRRSRLLRRLHAGDVAGALEELRRWTKARRNGALVDLPELARRRDEEAELFLRPYDDVAGGLPIRHSHVFSSPSQIMSVDGARFSVPQNPAAAAVLTAVSDAGQLGLAAVSVVQAGMSASSGSFQLTYDAAQRLLSTEARLKMPGAQRAKQSFTRTLFTIGSSRLNSAEATVIAQWEGNAYGEIGTIVMRKENQSSTDWTKSAASINIRRIERIPLPNTDPRAWPITFTYEGTYDPWGNGLFEFSGEFEVNAFGGLKFNRHEVYSRAAIDALVFGKPEQYVVKGGDVAAAAPEIPADQLEYVKTRLP